MQALMEVESKIASAEEKGMEKGTNEAKKEIALNLLAQGMVMENVAKVTGLTEDFLKTL
jgi:predicted transposase/invertase (TIGR01784 family)